MSLTHLFTNLNTIHKIYCKIAEDEKHIAFLDAMPLVKGHTLVVPKKEADLIFDLDSEDYKELWAFTDNRIAVRFAYECHDDSGNWTRSFGNENWEFNENGFMMRRFASINDLPIKESERKFFWPLGRRPDDHPTLSDFGF